MAESDDPSPHAVSSKQARAGGRKGCLDRFGKCRARFPREVVVQTIVDLLDGHVMMKKLEPMMNTFSPCITYLLRCNTDTTSLLSGTSIKAIVSYISDYITKPALKSHQVFSSMYDVFQKNGSPDTDVSTRRLVLQLVNNLTSKLEIGSPMASMYLLGNPDHYTSHSFVVFSWKSYVNHVRRCWNPDLEPNDPAPQKHCDDLCDGDIANVDQAVAVDNVVASEDAIPEDKILLGRHNGSYVGTTNVDDYRFRPDKFSSLSLHSWIQTYERRKGTKKELEKLLTAETTNFSSSKYALFKVGHPLRETHVVTCHPERRRSHVPNYIGGALPRHDQGDHEYYCCTMLTLFRPWRDGRCLKADGQTWEEAFASHNFSASQRKAMNNFNLRYECLDARDDFHAERRRQEGTAIGHARGPWIDGGDMDVEEEAGFQCDNVDMDFGDADVQGKRHLADIKAMEKTSGFLQRIGWLRRQDVQRDGEECFVPSVHLSSGRWSAVVKQLCKSIFREKLSGYLPCTSAEADRANNSEGSSELVRLLPPGYFLKNFKAEKNNSQTIIDETALLFSLNEEQERAFRIISNHAASLAPEQLRMYLGGMGGTGKSQVIKALIHMFGRRNENHRFAVLAPTGTAAALINGTTYHRAFGIRSKDDLGDEFVRNESAIINEARDRLQGVQYIFLDEISMVSCKDLYTISLRLAQIRNVHDVPFGGLNFIVAGDFAQLPPIAATPLYSDNVYKKQDISHSVKDQENTMGKILWHQFTTVVILKQNMRQRTQSVEDSKLRTALVNMRYAACTEDDITFLRTRIVAPGGNALLLKDNVDVRNVAVITRYNKTKDCINEEASQRFAEERGLQLHHFFSVNKLASSTGPGRKQKDRNPTKKRSRAPCFVSQADQEMLWSCSPHTNTKKIPSKLSLCVGMPVIIRYNEATELCITRGQDTIVVGWNASEGPYGRQVLETLFVRLVNPPKEVNIPDLPTNIVPLARMTTTTKCRLPSDCEITVQRQQVAVAPNFAITDYTSQGKTRDINVVDLADSESHFSIYTCLSRSSSAAGTFIIRDFDEKIITSGLSGKGWLRQEFRELNTLDEITRLRYEGMLPDNIFGPLRNPALRAYHLWMKGKPSDRDWHTELKYSPEDRIIADEEADGTWDLGINASTLSRGVVDPKKRKKKGADASSRSVKAPRLLNLPSEVSAQNSPRGLQWDPVNYSCAYDALLTVLYTVWRNQPESWSRRFDDVSPYMSKLSDELKRMKEGQQTLEGARDATRAVLHFENPEKFPIGQRYTSIDYICERLFNAQRRCGSMSLICDNISCGYAFRIMKFGEHTSIFPNAMHLQSPASQSISTFFGWDRPSHMRATEHECPSCRERGLLQNLQVSVTMQRVPYVLSVKIDINFEGCTIDRNLTYTGHDCEYVFRLRGIVYSGQGHFVSRVVDDDGVVWFHDGIATGSDCRKEATPGDQTNRQWLNTCRVNGEEKVAIIAIYDR